MTKEQADLCYEAFIAKAKHRPECLKYASKMFEISEASPKGVKLFTSDKPDAEAIASIQTIGSEHCFVSLWIDFNQYMFHDNHELCLELIERFVNLP